MRITLANPVYTVVGSADDKDASNGPGTSYGPANQSDGSCTDGATTATSTGVNETQLTADVNAQTTAHSSAAAKANAKTTATSSLTIAYSLLERVLRFFGLKPKLRMQVSLKMIVNVNDGPSGASFAVFFANGPTPIPAWSGSYSFSRDPANAAQLIAKRQDGVTITEPNPGRVSDYPDAKVAISPGVYQLTFEANAIASADGTVSVANDSRLSLRTA